MKLTDKCLEDFNKWYLTWIFLNKTYWSLNFEDYKILENWKSLHESEQYGVLVDFFDIKNIIIDDYKDPADEYWSVEVNYRVLQEDFKTRPEARTAAIKKANELYNSL